MSELRAPREVDMVPDALRYTPQVKSDIIIQRRDVSMAPVEGMSVYQRDTTNTITFNVQGHKSTNQLMDTTSLYFTWHCKFKEGYPVEDVSNLVQEIIISSNGRVLERIRHSQYIQWYLKQYEMSRKAKARLGKREGYNRFEDPTIQMRKVPGYDSHAVQKADNTVPNVSAWVGGAAADGGQMKVGPIPGDHGFSKAITDENNNASGFYDNAPNDNTMTRMSDNLGYSYFQTNRQFDIDPIHNPEDNPGMPVAGWPQAAAGAGSVEDGFGWKLMKFRLKCSGLLSCDKMLPIGWMPLTVQLRLSDKMRCTDKGGAGFDYAVKRPRMHFNVCTCGQAYASAMQQRLRGPGITINAKLYDTFFQIVSSDKQIVIPSNKQRLSKVYLMLHDENSVNNPSKNAFRSSVTGAYTSRNGLELYDGTKTGQHCLQSYQFQVGTEVSEPVTLEDQRKDLNNIDRSGATPH